MFLGQSGGGGREGLPDDGFADVGGVEEREDGAENVAFGEELVEEEIDQVSRALKLLGWRPPGSPGTGPGGF